MFWYILKLTASKSFKASFLLTYPIVIKLKTRAQIIRYYGDRQNCNVLRI